MMSSEEETDCFALYGASSTTAESKQQQLLKKQKRTRQRVDAGEPRNSYSSIPNFSSRPSFLGTCAASALGAGGGAPPPPPPPPNSATAGIYGSLFNNSNSGSGSGLQQQQQQQQQQHPQLSPPLGLPQQHSPPAQQSGGSAAAASSNQQQQQQQHAAATTGSAAAHASAFGGFFGAQGFGPPNKMLNELFGRQVKQATDAGASPPEGSMTGPGLDAAAAANTAALVNCDDPAATAPTELTQHMLREILQGRKLSALAASVQDQPIGHNNNSIHSNNNNNNNNNNNTTTELLKSQQLQQQQQQQRGDLSPVSHRHHQQQQQQQNNSESARSGAGNNNNNNNNNNSSATVHSGGEDSADDGAASNNGNNANGADRDVVMSADAEDSAEDAASAARAMEEAFAEAGMEPGANLDPGSDCDQSLPSSPTGGPRSGGSVSVKEELLQDSMKRSPSHSPCPSLQAPKTEISSPTTEIKRARVENIVSTMRSSPALPQQQAMPIVNGCKKRKLYHPQQQTAHHVLQQSSYHHVVNDVAMLDHSEEDSDEDEDCVVKQKREEKDHLKDQLNKLYEQVAVMQQKYNELSSRMGPETSESSDAPISPPLVAPSVLASHHASVRAHRAAVPSSSLFNGGLPSLPHDHAATAAMYQMVNQKFYLEQERYASVERMKQQQAAAAQVAAAQAAAARERELQEQQRERERQQALHQQQLSPQPTTTTPVRLAKTLQPHKDHPSASQEHSQSGLSALRGAVEMANSLPSITENDLESLAEKLKSEISSSLSNVIDSLMSRFLQQKKFLSKQMEAAQAAAEQLNTLNKDLMLASQCLERKSPRTKVVDRGPNQQQQQQQQQQQPPSQQPQQQPGVGPNGPRGPPLNNGGGPPVASSQQQRDQQQQQQQLAHQGGFSPLGTSSSASSTPGGALPPQPHGPSGALAGENNLNQLNQLPPGGPHARPSGSMFQTPKPPSIYASMASMQQQAQQQAQQAQQQQAVRDSYLRNTSSSEDRESRDAEQNEALSLVMTPKKKRSKVTDTRITPRVVSRILSSQDGNSSQGGADSPPPPPPPPAPRNPYAHAPPHGMLPVSLPTSVAIPNPSLHESQVFSPYSPFFNPHPGQVPPPGSHHHLPASPPGAGGVDIRDSPPLPPHPPAMLHPALLAAAQHGNPDFSHLRMDSNDRGSDCNSGEISYDGIQPTSSTLSPMHLRKAKLMFFWVRYPSSAVLKMYFPDIKFNKNNTAQLVKWFSNFREFYYIQMEKYARQAVQEGVKTVEDLMVGNDSEIFRVLNLHYNRNNHIEVWNQVPQNFRYVVEQTLKEFFKAIQGGKDQEQSWKKSIYKVISRLDDPVPEYFKSPNFLEQLE